MGQSPSSIRSKNGRRSFRSFVRRSKMNKSSLSHTFSLPPSEEYVEMMNINTATEEQLMTLPGVNRQLARAIVRHRQMIGRFKRVDDLALVSGIGAEKLELLRPEICISVRKNLSRTSSCTQSLDSIRTSGESRLCSVNSSSVFQLQCVPGLNQEIAANIVDYRNKKGPFKSLDDLIKVRGMDIVRLSTVKPYLNLELRKCESYQQLANGHLNGWGDGSLNGSILNGITSTPVPQRKSFSVPAAKHLLSFPNGFATAPVNDILELLSAYSHRPILEEEFKYERDGVRCCRIASWNLHQLSVEKITNPGVREVVCRTILENKLSIIAIQDVIEVAALRIICEELNSPVMRRVREWRNNSHSWEYCLREGKNQRLGFIYESQNRGGIRVEDVELEQACLLTGADVVDRGIVDALEALNSDKYTTSSQAFLVCDKPLVLVNVLCRDALNLEEQKKWSDVASSAEGAGVQMAFVGDFFSWENVQSIQNLNTLLNEELSTTVEANGMGHSSILHSGDVLKSVFNGHAGVIKGGLSHLAIPRGWSWGGPASPFCPIWAEVKIPD